MTALLTAAGPFVIDTTYSTLTLVEDKERKGKWILRGLFGRYGVPTNNGRVYTESVMRRNIKRLREDLAARKVFGELDHPADGRTKLSRVSHIITNLVMNDDGEIIGEAEILDTPAGKILKALCEAGAMVGVSSRGIGTTTPDSRGRKVVNEDYRLLSFDVVAEPANEGAHPAFFIEGKEASPADVNKADLRAAFPDLFREIELEAAAVATHMLAESLTTDSPTREQIANELRDEFAAKLATELQRVKAEASAQVEQATEGAHDSTGQVVLITEKLKATVAEKEALQKQLEDLEEVAKVLGYRYRLLQRLDLVDDAVKAEVTELVGDPLDYESLDDLDDAIDEAIQHVEEEAAEEEAEVDEVKEVAVKAARNLRDQVAAKAAPAVKQIKESHKTLRRKARAVVHAAETVAEDAEAVRGGAAILKKLQKQLSEEIERRKSGESRMKEAFRSTLAEVGQELAELRAERDEFAAKFGKAVSLAEELGAEAHAEHRLSARSDAPRMRRLLRKFKPRTRADVDTLLEEVSEPRRRGEFDEIRRHVSRRRGRSMTESRDRGGSGGDVMGVSMTEMARLAGIE